MKTLEFIYKDTEIHFLVNPNDKNVMVNATEMAKLFDRRTKDFLKTHHAKEFIEVAERALNGAHSDAIWALNGAQIIEDRGRNGMFFNKRLALKFAAWLSPEFEYWIYSTIDEIIFGNYQKHWEAHAIQEQAALEMEQMKVKLLTNPTVEASRAYFEALERRNSAKHQKTKAIRDQLSLFSDKQ